MKSESQCWMRRYDKKVKYESLKEKNIEFCAIKHISRDSSTPHTREGASVEKG